jgi:hypothetical protein
MMEKKSRGDEVEVTSQRWLGAWPSNDAFKQRLAFLVEGLRFSKLASDFVTGETRSG